MKTSEVLERALQLFGEHGERWTVKDKFHAITNDMNCAVTAIFYTCNDLDRRLLAYAALIGRGGMQVVDDVARWNDNAKDFSVIRAGFLKAIELAKQQEQANDN